MFRIGAADLLLEPACPLLQLRDIPALPGRLLHFLCHSVGLGTELIGRGDAAGAPGEQRLQRDQVQGVATAGEAVHSVGAHLQQDAGIMHEYLLPSVSLLPKPSKPSASALSQQRRSPVL